MVMCIRGGRRAGPVCLAVPNLATVASTPSPASLQCDDLTASTTCKHLPTPQGSEFRNSMPSAGRAVAASPPTKAACEIAELAGSHVQPHRNMPVFEGSAQTAPSSNKLHPAERHQAISEVDQERHWPKPWAGQTNQYCHQPLPEQR